LFFGTAERIAQGQKIKTGQVMNRDWALTKIIFWREFNTMYRRTSLGPLWAFVAPAAYLCIFIFFRLMFGLSNPEGLPIIPFLFSGLCFWLLFTQIITSSFPAITSNISILKKIPVSALVFVVSSSLLPLLTCGVYLLLLELLLLFYGYLPSFSYICIPAIMCLVFFFALGVGLLVASIAIYRQDIIQVLPTIIQLGMFATPIFFSPQILPENLRWVVAINPIAECIGMFRQIIFFNTWPGLFIFCKTLFIVAILWLLALPMFRRTTRYVADMY
jgi:lipopolysaccharide transport system permease protein